MYEELNKEGNFIPLEDLLELEAYLRNQKRLTDSMMGLVGKYTEPKCATGQEPHDFQVEDFSPEQSQVKCSKCGKKGRHDYVSLNRDFAIKAMEQEQDDDHDCHASPEDGCDHPSHSGIPEETKND
ncbi:MAG: hypothetical protein WCF48_04800 [Terriglobales bacterium]